MAENGAYTAKDIMVLSGPQGVRKRPAMYIGSTGSKGFFHLLYEILANAIDEAQSGYAKSIAITLTKEEGVDVAEVQDDGRGIPVDIIEKEGRPALEVIMTSLHSGGKFENKAYKVSGGLHGVGLTVVNSLSEYTIATVRRNGKIYQQRFSRGVVISPLEVIGETKSGDTGTSIRFKPDVSIFSAKSFDTIELNEILKETTFLCPGVRITLIDKRGETEATSVFMSEKGIPDFLEFVRGKTEAISKPVVIRGETEQLRVEVGIQYVGSYSENLLPFVNMVKTPEGGTHVVGVHTAITRAITSYISKNMRKGSKNGTEIEGEDTREGLLAIIAVYLANPEFEGQTKEKLGNPFVKNAIDSIVYSKFSTYLEENPGEASKIIGKVISAAQARESARKARELVRKKSLFEGSVLPGKLADCTEDDPTKSEIFIVEGDSAGGSSKNGRDRKYQAILPLKGKILNVEKASEEKIFGNAEIHTMVTAFGVGIKDQFKYEGLRYSKIILLADADVDGSHIRTLLLTFFYRYMKPLIEKGNIYIAQPPLYKVSKGKEHKYVYSDTQMADALKVLGEKAAVQRYKGLGEMNSEQLWDTTLNPENRVLKKVTIKDAQMAEAIFTVLMGLDVEQRRKFLEEHSHEVSFLDV
ncbi:MAG: DNA gyrase subunit B [Candidatus Micrarchaeota archaeon]|nr:DNA gyrase subunit B [Candidatus Micrarchaeota archaeon]